MNESNNMRRQTLPFVALAFLAFVQARGVTFDDWRVTYFNPTELSNLSISGSEADPDGDGTQNFSEYVLGTDPWLPMTEPIMVPSLFIQWDNLPYLRADFKFSPDAEGYLLLPQVTEQLGTRWRADQIGKIIWSIGDDGRMNASALDRVRADWPDKRFIRLFITKDGDEDGLPDDLEIAWGLNPNDPEDWITDSDGDGASDYAEFMAGTDPLNPGETIRGVEVPRPPANVQIIHNGDGSRDVIWDDRSDNEKYFVIYHTNANGVKTEIGRVGSGVTRFHLPAGY